ncbi:MAG: hypothetical protein U9O98_08995 [Asgard group archaeon]|nr:hypothetical protein [Asgard group archaeon]
MQICFNFKGSFFKQSEDITLTLEDKTSIYKALKKLVDKKPALKSKLFTDEKKLRSDILLFLGKKDIITLNLIKQPLTEDCTITILPLVHGG